MNSIDEQIEKEIYGIDDATLIEVTFENVVKRKSLMDMIKIFEDGFDIKKTTFFRDFPKFMKIIFGSQTFFW